MNYPILYILVIVLACIICFARHKKRIRKAKALVASAHRRMKCDSGDPEPEALLLDIAHLVETYHLEYGKDGVCEWKVYFDDAHNALKRCIEHKKIMIEQEALIPIVSTGKEGDFEYEIAQARVKGLESARSNLERLIAKESVFRTMQRYDKESGTASVSALIKLIYSKNN